MHKTQHFCRYRHEGVNIPYAICFNVRGRVVWDFDKRLRTTIQTFNSCTNQPEVCQRLVVQTPIRITCHGLRINVEKTKNIQIGGLRDNRMKSYNNKELIWTSEFESLGITFRVNGMKDITEMNMEKS